MTWKEEIQMRWNWLESYQKWFLIIVGILFPLGLIYPPIMDILKIPFALIACPG